MTSEIDAAKEYAEEEYHYLMKTFEAVPEAKLNYTPSSTSRSSLRIAAHAALSNHGMAQMLRGENSEFQSAEELDSFLKVEENKVTTRAQARRMLERSREDLLATLSAMSPEDLKSTCHTPFGEYPMAKMIYMPGTHMAMHASQIDYLQTIWGDMAYHM